jgi:very-short-patch-repair endonuclease
MTRHDIERRLLDGDWMHVMGDVLIVTGAPVTERMKAWTAVLAVGQPVALAGCMAGRELGLDQVPTPARPQLVVPNNRDPQGLPALDIRRTNRQRWSVVWSRGLPVTPPAVAIRDMAAELSMPVVRDIVQHALRRRRTTLEQLEASRRRGLAGSKRLREVLEEVAPGFQVKWERMVFRAVLRRGVRLQPQVPVRAADGRKAAIDLGIEDLRFGVEIDGFLNHMARFKADRRRARMLALELDWTIAPYAVDEIVDNLDAVADEIVRHVRRLQRLAA